MYAVLFDIDGTLVQTGGAGQLAFAETMAGDFGVQQIDHQVLFAGRSDRAISLELMALHDVEPNEENWNLFVSGYTRRLKETLARCDGRVLPGVVELLDDLAQIDRVVIGLLTGNIQAGAQRKLSHYGLAEQFEFGGFGDLHDNRNDIAAEAVRVATEHVTEPLKGVMVIGDTLADVQCAQSVGAFAVAVATGGNSLDELRSAEPSMLLADLTESDQLLAEVERALYGRNAEPG